MEITVNDLFFGLPVKRQLIFEPIEEMFKLSYYLRTWLFEDYSKYRNIREKISPCLLFLRALVALDDDLTFRILISLDENVFIRHDSIALPADGSSIRPDFFDFEIFDREKFLQSSELEY